MAAGITGFLVKVNKGKWEVNKFLFGTLFGTLRWVELTPHFLSIQTPALQFDF